MNDSIWLLYFIIMAVFNFLSCLWIYNLLFQIAGVTKCEVKEYKDQIVIAIGGVNRMVLRWMEQRSPNPKKFRRVIWIYTICMAPSFLCVNLALMSYTVPFLDRALGPAAVIMPVIIAAEVVAGILYRRKAKKAGATQRSAGETQSTPKEEAPDGKTIALGALKVAVAVGSLFLLFFVVLHLFGSPKTPATANQVWEAVVAQGYQPLDVTQEWWQPDSNLNKAIATEYGDLCLYFFTFGSDTNARSASQQFDALIRRTKDTANSKKWREQAANYSLYTLKSDGEYTVLARVGHTVLYAYTPEENAGLLRTIMEAIGYF
ncbi:hypothetical protein [Zongyangia hominis]|uniref:Uncharacterized protein n=1 Tax=Zongyangia hominis TaxID=2763677 RepID=A0A926EA90_9FIRM|nr:hypothetical protein [Zongyangia hominis]MBC8570187.1 hypothetical protein [Zongyangia hominis]